VYIYDGEVKPEALCSFLGKNTIHHTLSNSMPHTTTLHNTMSHTTHTRQTATGSSLEVHAVKASYTSS
jgi:hypothetical protein